MNALIIEDEKAAVRNLTALLSEAAPPIGGVGGVGRGRGGHAKFNGTIDHILDTGCAVEHGENSVIVQMDECHVMSSDAGSCSD